MRILIVSSGLRPEHFGGLPSHVEDLLNALSGAGEEVAYLNVGEKSKWPGTRVSKRDGLSCPAWNLSSSRAFARFWTGTVEPETQVVADSAFHQAFFKVVDEFRPQIVHFHELTSVPIQIFESLAARKIKLVFSAHDFYVLCPTVKLFRPDGTLCERSTEHLDCQNCSVGAGLNRYQQWGHANELLFARYIRLRNIGRRVIRSLEKSSLRLPESSDYQQRRRDFIRILSRVDVMLVTSRAQEEIIRRHSGDSWRLRFLPLSRSTIRPVRPPPRKALVKPGVLTFVALNIVNPAKGLNLLTSTFAGLAADSLATELKLFGMESGESPGILSFGQYQDEQLDDILTGSDFGIIPSLWPEAFGYVGPEMLSRGLPVIASKMGAMPDYVIDGVNGLLFDPNMEGDLAAKIRTLLTNESLREKLWQGVASGQRQYLTMDEHVDGLRGVYTDLVDGRAANVPTAT